MTDIELRKGGPEDLQSAWRILAAGAPTVAGVLIEIAEDRNAPAGARVQASQALLDRVGISARPEVTVRVVPAEYDNVGATDDLLTPADIVRKRMADLKQASIAAAVQAAEEAEIYDAVIVED